MRSSAPTVRPLSSIVTSSENSLDVPLKTPAKPVSTASKPSSMAGVTVAPSGCPTEKPFLGETKVFVRSGKSSTPAAEEDGDGLALESAVELGVGDVPTLELSGWR